MRLYFLVCLLGCGSDSPAKLAAAPETITAITYNMYFGIPTEIVPQNTSAASLAGSLNAVIAGVSLTDYRCRIDGAAKVIAGEMPDVIGTQETILIAYAHHLNDRGEDDVVVDFATELVSAIQRHTGQHYQAFVRENTVIQAALPVVGGLRMIERSAILVSPRLPVTANESLTYSMLQSASDVVPGGTGEVIRGAQHVQISFSSGEAIDVYNTHLQSSGTGSSASEPVRFAQAQELVNFINTTRKPGSTVIALGDMNDTPGSRTYDVLTSGLVDTYGVAGRPPGFTAYQDQSLTNPTNTASMRIDYVLADTPMMIESHLVFTQMVSPCNLWPSDHFGVSSRFNKAASQ
jgi:endonuclease/exonuclease/phosphatase family metal-dependent hydrolase